MMLSPLQQTLIITFAVGQLIYVATSSIASRSRQSSSQRVGMIVGFTSLGISWMAAVVGVVTVVAN